MDQAFDSTGIWFPALDALRKRNESTVTSGSCQVWEDGKFDLIASVLSPRQMMDLNTVFYDNLYERDRKLRELAEKTKTESESEASRNQNSVLETLDPYLISFFGRIHVASEEFQYYNQRGLSAGDSDSNPNTSNTSNSYLNPNHPWFSDHVLMNKYPL